MNRPDFWIAMAGLVAIWLVTESIPAASRRRARVLVTVPRSPLNARLTAPSPHPWSALSLRLPGSRRRAEQARRTDAVTLLVALSAELRAGQPPGTALREAAASVSTSVCPIALVAAKLGAGIDVALRLDSRAAGGSVLRGLAACWQVGEVSGARFAEAVDRLIARAARDNDVRRQLSSELAAPRATARLVGSLPIMGLVIGHALGANPVGWLFGSPLGLLVLGSGVSLDLLGFWWMAHLVRTVETRMP